MTGCDCEAYAHENCPTARETARAEAQARRVALHGVHTAGVPACDQDDPEAKALAAWGATLGLYAEALRRGAMSSRTMLELLDVLPPAEVRGMLLAAMNRLADAEDAR